MQMTVVQRALLSRRIAEAMDEGIDGRSCASPDAQELHRLYQQEKQDDPSLLFSECGIRARQKFISSLLKEYE